MNDNKELFHNVLSLLNYMKNSISKLTILFIVAILIPGSVLTYFSVQNIASQRDLTEKRVLEEQDQLATELVDQFQDLLLKSSSSFYALYDTLLKDMPESMIALDSMEFVMHAFIVDRQGRFVWPHFNDKETQSKYRHLKTEPFLQSFSSAESAEFQHADFRKAAELYENALHSAKNDDERASAINSLARVLGKQGFLLRAIQQYQILVNRYGSVTDENEYPFAYYALHQLMQFYPRISYGQILLQIENLLRKITEGRIPLTNQMAYLLEDLEEWYQTLPAGRTNHVSIIPDHIDRIRRTLTFVSQDGDAIKQFLRSNQTRSPSKLGSFSTINGTHNDQPYLIIIRNDLSHSNILGFKVHLNHLKNMLLSWAQDNLENSDIDIEILTREQLSQMETGFLSTVRELSPVVPLWRLWIHPGNPRAISQYIAKQRWIYGIAISLLMAGMIFGIVLVVRDVSREQKLAQLRSDFVSNVTHELKTPLTSIRMFAETMRMGRVKNKSDQKEYLSVIVSESERLTRLINTVLDFSKIEQGEKQYHMKQVNLSQIVDKALSAMEYWLKAHGFEVTADIEPNVEFMGDEDALEQAILNLISNAMKYSDDLKVITVRLYQKAGNILLEVRDRGLGIPESSQPFVFDKYYRAHSGHKRDKEGSGLGLAVVKHIVVAHQGRIELASKVNEGSIFTIVLPKT